MGYGVSVRRTRTATAVRNVGLTVGWSEAAQFDKGEMIEGVTQQMADDEHPIPQVAEAELAGVAGHVRMDILSKRGGCR